MRSFTVPEGGNFRMDVFDLPAGIYRLSVLVGSEPQALAADLRVPGRLARAGVQVLFTSQAPDGPADGLRLTPGP